MNPYVSLRICISVIIIIVRKMSIYYFVIHDNSIAYTIDIP